jgi:GT2 family glycosyltransferase
MDLSIVIVTYNSQEFILNCLASVRRAAMEIDHETIVIDNDSTDETKALMKTFGNSITFLGNPENYGFARAVNMGLQRATGDFLLLLNPDTVIKSDSLSPMIDFMRRNSRVGICGCKLLNRDGSLQYSKGSFPTLFSLFYRRVLPRRMRKYHLWGYGQAGPCDWVTGAFVCIRKSVIEDIGYLDKNYFIYYEDLDYCLRTKKKGYEIYYDPQIETYHLKPHAISPWNPPVENEIKKSRLHFFRKNKWRHTYHLLLLSSRIMDEMQMVWKRW